MAGKHLSKKECLLQPELYPWADRMAENDFVSQEPSYRSGEYLGLFSDEVWPSGEVTFGDIRYFVYDPVAHGMPADRKYPLLFALHGSGGSLVGKTAVNWAGAELFASPEYQEKTGGVYIVAPLANEYRDSEGETARSWMTPVPGKPFNGYEKNEIAGCPYPDDIKLLCGNDSVYTAALTALVKAEAAAHPYIGKKIVAGASAGGYGAWRLLISNPGLFDAGLIMAGAYMPSRRELETLRQAGTRIWICHGKLDELCDYPLLIEPILPQLRNMPDVELYLPDFVRRADGGIASNIGSGFQMGQHCINDIIQENLFFLDGRPMDPRHPGGVTAWIAGL